MGCTKDMVAMQGIGYKEMLSYLDGSYSLEEAVYIIKRETRHFAKRQITWFKRDSRIRWYDAAVYADISALGEAIAAQFLQEDGEE